MVALPEPAQPSRVIDVPDAAGGENLGSGRVWEQSVADGPASQVADLVEGGLQGVHHRRRRAVGGHRHNLKQLEKGVATLELRLDVELLVRPNVRPQMPDAHSMGEAF